MTGLIQVSTLDRVLTIRINRPEKKNALTFEMYENIAIALETAAGDQGLRAIVLCGAKGSYCAGNDLNDFLQTPPSEATQIIDRFLKALVNTSLPIVAAVDGIAVGIGVTMLLHCDLVYISKSSKLSLPFVDLALVPEAGSSMLLPRLIGYQKAAELLLLGEPFSAEFAMEVGLANAIFEAEELEVQAFATAKKLSLKSRQSLVDTKALMRRDSEPIAERMAVEGEIFKRNLSSVDTIEAMTAIMEKRKPNFA